MPHDSSSPDFDIARLFYQELHPEKNLPSVSHNIGVERFVEYRLAAIILAAAYKNPVVLDYDIQSYSRRVGTGVKVGNKKEETLKKAFPPKFGDARQAMTEPMVVVDRKGRILVWYLPGILSRERSDEIFEAISVLEPELLDSVGKDKSWRTEPGRFLDLNSAGSINISPAWFQQAHDPLTSDLEVSRLLKHPGNGRQWVHKMRGSFDVLNAISSIIHPDQHQIGQEAMIRLRNDHSLVKEGLQAKDLMVDWTTVFSAIAIVLNRETPTHRDMQSPATGLDIMLTVGPYSEAWMTLETLGLDLLYRSGSVVALSGSLIPHAVECKEVGRLCLSFYMRYSVHEKLGLDLIEYTRHAGYST